MNEITFLVEACAETGGYVARWDDVPGRGGITTQGDSFAELEAMIADAVNGFFEPNHRPQRVRLFHPTARAAASSGGSSSAAGNSSTGVRALRASGAASPR